MRNLLIVVVTVALLAAPSLGVINIKLTADKTYLGQGNSTTVHVLAQGTSAGVFSLAGDIVGNELYGQLIANPGSLAFTSDFLPTSLYVAKPGTPGTNGGWTNIGSLQTTWASPNPLLGKDNYVEFCHYTVMNASTPIPEFSCSLTFVPKTVSGFKPTETDKTTAIGTITLVTLYFDPEPLTIALLALGLAGIRRRP